MTMTITEAITHARASACGTSCGKEHEQLAEWLEELVRLREENKILNAAVSHEADIADSYKEERNALAVQTSNLKSLLPYVCVSGYELEQKYVVALKYPDPIEAVKIHDANIRVSELLKASKFFACHTGYSFAVTELRRMAGEVLYIG